MSDIDGKVSSLGERMASVETEVGHVNAGIGRIETILTDSYKETQNILRKHNEKIVVFDVKHEDHAKKMASLQVEVDTVNTNIDGFKALKNRVIGYMVAGSVTGGGAVAGLLKAIGVLH